MKRRAISQVSTITIIVAIVAAVGGYFAGSIGNQPPTVTSTSVSTDITTSVLTVITTEVVATSTQSVNHTAGVKLKVSMNSTSIVDAPSKNIPSTILVTLSEYNILSHVNNLTANNGWPLANVSVGGCDYHEPFGIAVYKGNYSLQNVSSASSIDLFPVSLGCVVPSLPAKSYSFLPDSNTATIITSPYFESSNGNSTTTISKTYSSEAMTGSIQLNGYCCRQVHLAGGAYTVGLIPFDAGTYTLAAGDMWGDLVVLHFTVMTNS